MNTARRSPAVRYGTAMGATVLAVVARAALPDAWQSAVPLVTLFPAVAASAWFGGFGPGVLATALGAACATWLWMSAQWTLDAHTVTIARFVLVGVGMTVMIASLRRARRRHAAERARAEQARAQAEAAEGRVTAVGDVTRQAEVLAALAAHIGTTLHLDRILQGVAEATRDLCAADHARIALREPDGAMVYRYVVGARVTGYEGLRLGSGHGFVGRVLETGRPFRTADAAADPSVHPDYGRRLIEQEGTRTAMVVPIVTAGTIEGSSTRPGARRSRSPMTTSGSAAGSPTMPRSRSATRSSSPASRPRAATPRPRSPPCGGCSSSRRPRSARAPSTTCCARCWRRSGARSTPTPRPCSSWTRPMARWFRSPPTGFASR